MSDWYRWFAWHPVNFCDEDSGIWLAWVWRKDVLVGGSASGESTEHRYKRITPIVEFTIEPITDADRVYGYVPTLEESIVEDWSVGDDVIEKLKNESN